MRIKTKNHIDPTFKWSRWRMESREINHIYLGEQVIVPMGNYKALKKAQREYLLSKEDE